MMSACFSSGVWSCLMHALSSQTRGSAAPSRRASSPHETSCSYLAGPGSCHECEMKPSTWPSFAVAVFSYRPVSALLMRSDSCSSDSRSARKRLTPSASASDAEPPPTRAAIVAASASLVLLAPTELTKCWNLPRLRGVKMAPRKRTTKTKKNCQRGCLCQVTG